MTKVAGVMIGDSNLATQSLAFLHELTEVVSTLERISLIISLPSSFLEHYDEISGKIYESVKIKPKEKETELLFQQLQKIAGRVEKIYTPIQDHELSKIIRQRLFSKIDLNQIEENVQCYIDYIEKESILPFDIKLTEYKAKFLDSYPFLPEVIDVLYYRWGSFPTFQRTRGLLRLLSLVISLYKDQNKAYLSLSDFDLSNQEIRQELIKHLGNEYNSIIAQDITSDNSGAKKVDSALGNAYRGLMLGTRTATTIFLYSFSGGQEKGCTIFELKRLATTIDNPSSVVVEALQLLKNKYLFYLQCLGDRYYFNNIPNINRILLNVEENITENQIREVEKEIKKKSIKGKIFKVYFWEENPELIPDTKDFKLLILKSENNKIMSDILSKKGQNTRIYPNTLFFLTPCEQEIISLEKGIKTKIAYEIIKNDQKITKTKEQEIEIDNGIKKSKEDVENLIARSYRIIWIPKLDTIKSIDMGIPSIGEKIYLDSIVLDFLRNENEILEKIDPNVLKIKYLENNEYASTSKIYQSSFTTRGEIRFEKDSVLKASIINRVEKGIFGLGEIKENIINLNYFKKRPEVNLNESEVIISEKKCKELIEKSKIEESKNQNQTETPDNNRKTESSSKQFENREIKEKNINITPEESLKNVLKDISLSFKIPKGKVSQIMGILNFLQKSFENINITIKADEGEISQHDYEEKIKEALFQIGIKFD